MTVSRTEILEIAAETGFDSVMLEKVVRLIGLLNLLTTHPYLKGRWVLKGGTALWTWIPCWRSGPKWSRRCRLSFDEMDSMYGVCLQTTQAANGL
jgi:hypothetical protein